MSLCLNVGSALVDTAGPEAEASTESKIVAKRESRKRHWVATVTNPTEEDSTAFWMFNQPEGPVPIQFKLGYIFTGYEDAKPPCKTAYLHIYFELSERVRSSQLTRWFGSKPDFAPR